MIFYSNIAAIIGDVTELVVEPIYDEFADLPLLQRTIIVRTEKGETFELTLKATKKQHLRAHTKHTTPAWLTPKVYKGNEDDDNT
jgi:hypothetical protein